MIHSIIMLLLPSYQIREHWISRHWWLLTYSLKLNERNNSFPICFENGTCRYSQEQTVTVNVDNQNYALKLCGDSNDNDLDNSWSSQVVTDSSHNDSYSNTFEPIPMPMIDDDANNSISMSSSSSSSKQQSQQHFCFFGGEIDQVNHDEQDNSMLPIPWSNLNAWCNKCFS